MKKFNSAAELATKHAILFVVVSSNKSRSSCKQTTCLLNVHPRNVTKVIQCWKLMNFFGKFLWTLSIHDKKSNMLSLATKAMVLTWWSFEMHMSPNHKEVVKKCLAPHVYDNKPPQHLLETRVLSTLSLLIQLS